VYQLEEGEFQCAKIHKPFKCELEHGLRGGTTMEQLVQELTLPGLSHSLVEEQALRGARSIVHYLTMDHITTLWLAKGKHIMTLVACLPLLLATLKIPMISIPFFESQFLWDHMTMRCVLCSFNFYNTNKMVHTFVISTLYPLGVWASCKGLLHTPH